MNKMSILTLKTFRKFYRRTHPHLLLGPECVDDPNEVSDIIYKALKDEKPKMIARYMANEFSTLFNYLGYVRRDKNIISFIKGKTPPWWKDNKSHKQLYTHAGFYPPTSSNVEKFCKLLLSDIQLIDILGSWRSEETYFDTEFKSAQKVHLFSMDPFWSKKPWTQALEGKKVLVIHPFSETIQDQYRKRKFLFNNNLLPDFDLKTIKAIQSIAGTRSEHTNWFEALNFMKSKMDKIDYDICITAAGAYGLPLAAHAKRMGKKGFNLGGSTQLLFGIKGKRWENQQNSFYNRNKNNHNYSSLFNEHWVRPTAHEKPVSAENVEGACYW